MPKDPHRSLWRYHRTHGPSCAQFLGKYEWAPPARNLNKVAAIFAQLCSLSLSGPNTVNDPERHSFRWGRHTRMKTRGNQSHEETRFSR